MSDHYAWAAKQLGCDIDAIETVAMVESRERGFLDDGRPTILFERHIFSRLTKGRWDATWPDLSSSKPGGYGLGGAAQYFRLDRAIELDQDAALKSASWGRFQIMGFNHLLCGYTLKEFVRLMKRSNFTQLKVFVSFIQETQLDAPLRDHRWKAFARGYNGPAYAKHGYHRKLKFAHRQLFLLHQINTVEKLQFALVGLGLNPGPVDNRMGPKTRKAIGYFQTNARMTRTEKDSPFLRAALGAAQAYKVINNAGNSRSKA